MSITIDLHYVDELIAVRRSQHGGYQGAPPKIGRYRQGESINRSCVVMLSAQLQTYVEAVFLKCSRKVLPALTADQAKYKSGFSRWGNPNPGNIEALFLRLGVEKVLSGLSWQKCPEPSIRAKLTALNEIRNDIAHGEITLKVSNREISLSLAQVEKYRDFINVFASHFEPHALTRVKNK